MKRNILKYIVIAAVVILAGTGFAYAGGGRHASPHFRGYHHGNPGWGYNHHARHHHYHGPRHQYYHHYRHYGPPARYYHHYYYRDYYYRGDCGPYDGAYYFSGAFSEPGFGFSFGTRGNW
jgi:hypothetical protein